MAKTHERRLQVTHEVEIVEEWRGEMVEFVAALRLIPFGVQVQISWRNTSKAPTVFRHWCGLGSFENKYVIAAWLTDVPNAQLYLFEVSEVVEVVVLPTAANSVRYCREPFAG